MGGRAGFGFHLACLGNAEGVPSFVQFAKSLPLSAVEGMEHPLSW